MRREPDRTARKRHRNRGRDGGSNRATPQPAWNEKASARTGGSFNLRAGQTISSDGSVVAFESDATNLVVGDTNDLTDIFVRVLQPSGCDGCPGAPSNLAATVARSSVSFTWTEPTAGGVVEDYVFRVGLRPAATDIEFATGGAAPTFNAPNVPDGTYYVRVHGNNGFGTGPPSNEILLTVGVGACPEPPRAPTALSASVRNGMVTLTWASSAGCPASSYVLEAGRSPGASDAYVGDVGNVLALTATAAGPGTYYVRVRGRNEFGISGPSNEVVIVVP